MRFRSPFTPTGHVVVLMVAFWVTVFAGIRGCEAATEADHVRVWCEDGAIEYRLPDATRVDCLLDDYAVEADWAHKWAEAIGQALYYADQTHRKPGILLIVKLPDDLRYLERLLAATGDLPIRIWLMEKLPEIQL